ncbi:uncharacterized protein ACA1_129360 [Acanthamoeba castellanii str. Neff]|uniref:Transmembrane protein n=1 Tax=Acanthamoeba castellanii (strain ATCC 30010 / Neff) TaxID=1257118 RepID=L8GRQ0_ACACF|nr:uncharacterized protein ACA1_129360 [Acanthamoeba castellanii str. Neff]ELR14821.1 hypothetical protein ACA1_129360 [Acanthamoeba castellanii str. Neff]
MCQLHQQHHQLRHLSLTDRLGFGFGFGLAIGLALDGCAPSNEQSGPRLVVVLGLVGGGGVLVLLVVALVAWIYHRRAMLEGANMSTVYSRMFETTDSSVPLLSRDEADEDDAHINP